MDLSIDSFKKSAEKGRGNAKQKEVYGVFFLAGGDYLTSLGMFTGSGQEPS